MGAATGAGGGGMAAAAGAGADMAGQRGRGLGRGYRRFVDVKGRGGGGATAFGVMRGFGHVAVFTYYIEKSVNEAEIRRHLFPWLVCDAHTAMHISLP